MLLLLFEYSQLFLSSDHGLDTVVHVLDECDFGAAESSQVGDVVDVVISLRVLAVGTSDLHVVLSSDGLKLLLLVAELGELDVHGGAETSSQVGRARGDVTEVVVVSELSFLLDAGDTSGESLEDLSDV